MAHRKIDTLMKYHLPFLFVAALVAMGCSKTRHTEVDAALQNAYSFQKGTYWIYKDSLSGDVDSFFVTDQSIVAVETDDDINDRIFITISEKSEYRAKTETSQWQLLLNHSTIDLSWIQDNATPISRPDYNYDPLAFYPFVIGTTVGDEHYVSTIMQIFGTYPIGANTFKKVALINESLSIPPNNGYPYMNDWLYLSDGIGIIKMHLYHPQDTLDRIWELQGWHIVK